MPNATHFQRLDDGEGAIGGVTALGGVYCSGEGGRFTGAIDGGAGAGGRCSGGAVRGKARSALTEFLIFQGRRYRIQPMGPTKVIFEIIARFDGVDPELDNVQARIGRELHLPQDLL